MFTGLKDYEYLMQIKLYIPNVNSDISCQLGSHIPAHEYKVSVMSATVQKIFKGGNSHTVRYNHMLFQISKPFFYFL